MSLCCLESLNSFRSNLDSLKIFKVAQESGQSPCTIVHGLGPKMTRIEIFIFIIFSDTYTCPYVVLNI